MLLFCMAINPVLEEIQKSYKCISYADDIVIAHSSLIPAKQVISEIGALLLKRGLQLSEAKCCSTEAVNSKITFLGQEFT
jgi:hypothetical protein